MPQSPPVRVSVMAATGETTTVSGRVACMVLWLVRHADKLNEITTGRLIFHLGRECKPEITQSFEPIDRA